MLSYNYLTCAASVLQHTSCRHSHVVINFTWSASGVSRACCGYSVMQGLLLHALAADILSCKDCFYMPFFRCLTSLQSTACPDAATTPTSGTTTPTAGTRWRRKVSGPLRWEPFNFMYVQKFNNSCSGV